MLRFDLWLFYIFLDKDHEIILDHAFTLCLKLMLNKIKEIMGPTSIYTPLGT
jgi:hypothetical protein